MKNIMETFTPETRRLLIKAAAFVAVAALASAVTIVVTVARNDGLGGLFSLLEKVI